MTQPVTRLSNWFPVYSNHILTQLPRPANKPKPPASIWKVVRGVLLLSICSLLLLPHGALAQEFRGTISGTVTDPSGAVVPGAGVKVLETQTGAISQTVTNHAGQYVVPFLQPGDYSITVTASGFQTLTRGGITLQTQAHLIINFSLNIGGSTQVVKVTGQAPLVNLANASVGDVIESNSMANLPLYGRAPEMFASLAVGVSITQAPHMYRPWDADAPWSMGGTTNQNEAAEILIDGAPDEDFDGGWAFSPQQVGVREVSVQPFDTDASYGHTVSGVINMITKSGTNALHGTAYEFNALSNLDANTFFNDRKIPVPPVPVNHFNQYGLTVGGPVLIPKVFNGRKKLFFFFGWEGLKQVAPTPTLLTVPTKAEREGDFHALLAGGSSYQIYEPNTGTLQNGKFERTPVPNNCLTDLSSYCSSVANAGITIDPIAAAYMKLFPLPNYTAGVSPITNEDNYESNAPGTVNFNSFFGRMDYNVSARDHVFFDVRRTFGTGGSKVYFPNNATGQVTSRWNWGTMLDNVYTLNPTTVFDMRFNETIHSNNEVPASAGTSLNANSVGFPSYMQSSSDFPVLPLINFQTFEELAPNGTEKLSTFTNYQFFADMMKIVGRHTLKIGLDARQYTEVQTNPADSTGAFTFSYNFVNAGTGAASQPCCADLASFEYGLPTSGDYEFEPLGDFRTYYIAGFFQDDWRVNNHLSLDLGLRYNIDTPWGEKFGRTVDGFNPAAVNSASAAASAAFTPTTVTASDATVNVSSINTLGGLTFPRSDWGAPYQIQDKAGFWCPRFGFSYNPQWFKKTVLRGGFGLFLLPQTISKKDDSGYINQQGFGATTAFAATNDNYYSSQSALDNPFPHGFTQPKGSAEGASTFLGSPSAISFLAPVEHDMYAVRWTFGVQREIGNNTLVELVYEGNHGVHLPVNNNINAMKRQYLNYSPWRDQNLITALDTAVPNPFAGLLANGNSEFNGTTTSLVNLVVPYPAYGNASITEEDMSIGQSFFEAAMLHVEHRSSHGLTLMANYQYAKTIEQDTYLNPEDTTLFRGESPTADFRHHFAVGGSYQLPFGTGKLFSLDGSRLANEIVGGWVINGIYQFQTGLPIDFKGDIPLQPGATIHDIKSNTTDSSPTVPALSTGVFVTGSKKCKPSTTQSCDGSAYFNGQYAYHYRTLPLTMGWVREDGFNNLDASMLKNFRLTKDGRIHLQIRFETFNTLNHPSFGPPVLKAKSKTFGFLTELGKKSQARQVQLGGRIFF